ncbi:hypothetical protein V8F06_001743 [Rhypophila decipiens]
MVASCDVNGCLLTSVWIGHILLGIRYYSTAGDFFSIGRRKITIDVCLLVGHSIIDMLLIHFTLLSCMASSFDRFRLVLVIMRAFDILLHVFCVVLAASTRSFPKSNHDPREIQVRSEMGHTAAAVLLCYLLERKIGMCSSSLPGRPADGR